MAPPVLGTSRMHAAFMNPCSFRDSFQKTLVRSGRGDTVGMDSACRSRKVIDPTTKQRSQIDDRKWRHSSPRPPFRAASAIKRFSKMSPSGKWHEKSGSESRALRKLAVVGEPRESSWQGTLACATHWRKSDCKKTHPRHRRVSREHERSTRSQANLHHNEK